MQFSELNSNVQCLDVPVDACHWTELWISRPLGMLTFQQKLSSLKKTHFLHDEK